jgi:hypothetical protein
MVGPVMGVTGTGFKIDSVLEALVIGQQQATRTPQPTRTDEHLLSALIAGRRRPKFAC